MIYKASKGCFSFVIPTIALKIIDTDTHFNVWFIAIKFLRYRISFTMFGRVQDDT